MSVFFPGSTLTVTPQTGSRVNGVWTSAAGAPFTITGTVQGLSAYKMQTLPEGKRLRGVRSLITDASLSVTDPEAGTLGDLVTVDGEQWQVDEKTPYNNLIPHYEYLLVRMKEGT